MLKIFQNKKFLLVLALINFVAGFYSITYYLPQLARTDFWFWLFVIDCPFYAILFGVLLLLRIKEKNFSLLGFVIIVGSMKYSFWTIFVLFLMNNIFNNWLIMFSHVLLLAQVIIFYKFFEFKLKHFFVVVLWFLLNDFFDYVLLTHPFFDTNFFVVVASFSILTSLFLSFFVGLFFSKK